MGLQNDKSFILTWPFVPNTVVFLWISAAGVVLPGVAGRSPGSADLPGVAGRSPGSALAGEGPGVALAGEVVPAGALLDLRDLGAARGLSFVPVSATRPLGLPAYSAAVVDAIEAELEQARTALSALEESNASARLRKVEADLLAHPHLPQAAFLMAECLALQAQAARGQASPQATELDARRLALEGQRAAAFGEAAPGRAAPANLRLQLQGLEAMDELELDGVRLAAGVAEVGLAPGLHHARVWRAGRPIFATFAQVSAEQTSFQLQVPGLVPCSAEDFEAVPRDARNSVPRGVACQRWARVREESGGIGVALCEHSQCGAFFHWQRRVAAPFAPIARVSVESRRFPAWAGFALAGTAAVLASGVVLWQSGAFERGRPSAATWQYDGLNPQALRF